MQSKGKLNLFKPKFRISKEILVFFFICILVLIYFSFNEEEYKLDYFRKKLEETQIKVSTLSESKKNIEEKIRSLQTDNGIETMAREELKLVMPGEIIIIPKVKNNL